MRNSVPCAVMVLIGMRASLQPAIHPRESGNPLQPCTNWTRDRGIIRANAAIQA
jgi:hypothetical protein